MALPAITPRYSASAAEEIVHPDEMLRDDQAGDTGTARGILLGLAISTVMWAIIGFAIDAIFG